MSLLDKPELLEVKLYYYYKQGKYGKTLKILGEEESEKKLQEPPKPNDPQEAKIEILTTKWLPLLWKDQNDVMKKAYAGSKTGSTQEEAVVSFDVMSYQDSVVKKSLKEWDIKDSGGNPIPVTSDNIDRLPATIVTHLYQQVDRLLDYTEEEVKN